MKLISDTFYMLASLEILAMPILFVVWLIRKIRKKPKMKWLKWFWISFVVLLAVAIFTKPSEDSNDELKVHTNIANSASSAISTQSESNITQANAETNSNEPKVEYSKAVKQFAKKHKVSEKLVQSFKDALKQTDFPVAFEDFTGWDPLDNWAAGERFQAWHYNAKEDKYYRLLLYVSHDSIESMYDITDGHNLIYGTSNLTSEEENNSDCFIHLTDGALGNYGKEVTVNGQKYIWYMVPAGMYTAENQLQFATIFIVADNNAEDVRQTVQFSENGQTEKIIIEEGTHIELSIRSEIILTPIGKES